MEKLECLKEISKQFYDMEDAKTRLIQQMKDDQDESKLMKHFQKEKDRLTIERDELVECLKQINNDILMMENIIVQTDSERCKNIESTKRLIDDLNQRKQRINKLRSQLSLPSLENDSLLDQDLIGSKTDLLINRTVSKPLAAKTNSLNFGLHHSDQNLSTLGERRAERTLSSSFLQQPPPMKTCMNCNQQIHRNAPICPYCKAKSRSRNPKKPKRKIGNEL